jgi:hypothetical protein
VRSKAAEARRAEATRKSATRNAKIEEARKMTVAHLIDAFLEAKGAIRSLRQYRQMLDLNVRAHGHVLRHVTSQVGTSIMF